MRTNDKTPSPKKPKDIAEDISARVPYDKVKAAHTNRRAVQAADRLLREMDDVLKHLSRKI